MDLEYIDISIRDGSIDNYHINKEIDRLNEWFKNKKCNNLLHRITFM